MLEILIRTHRRSVCTAHAYSISSPLKANECGHTVMFARKKKHKNRRRKQTIEKEKKKRNDQFVFLVLLLFCIEVVNVVTANKNVKSGLSENESTK